MSPLTGDVYGEGQALTELEWMELLYRMDDLRYEHTSAVVEGGEVMRQSMQRIADTAFEIARRVMLEEALR